MIQTRRTMATVLAVAALTGISVALEAQAGPGTPKADLMDSAGVTVLKGLTVPEFDEEMKAIVQALGVNGCQYCHVRGNFASDEKPPKATARRMLEMTLALNRQFFPTFVPPDGGSRLGRVTCFTCHQGATSPKATGE